MTNYATGHSAEKVAADYLNDHGYKVLEINWKIPAAEIDIVARKTETVYFFEVKYRLRPAQGGGLDYITSQKLRHMRRAAELWCAHNHWEGTRSLAAIEVSGLDYDVTALVDNIY